MYVCAGGEGSRDASDAAIVGGPLLDYWSQLSHICSRPRYCEPLTLPLVCEIEAFLVTSSPDKCVYIMVLLKVCDLELSKILLF